MYSSTALACRNYGLNYTGDSAGGMKFWHVGIPSGVSDSAGGPEVTSMYLGMGKYIYGASYILYRAADTCMVRALLVRAYSA